LAGYADAYLDIAVQATKRKDVPMLLFSLNLFSGHRNDDDAEFGGSAGSQFPKGQLSSSAWEGWHDET
jgi:hypothetical protein